MQKLLLVLLVVLSIKLNAQISADSTCANPYGGNDPLDSLYFENDLPHKLKLVIDTSFQGNIWQVGAVQKSGFPGAFSATHALQTDTLNSYPVGNESAAVVYFDSSNTWATNFTSLSFWHYYETDALNDSCLLQVSIDSGKSWTNFLSIQMFQPYQFLYYNGSLNNYSGQILSKDTLFWSGSSGGWRKETICAYRPGAKGITLPQIYGFRFVFKSDSTETNKPGWIIDNIIARRMTGSPGSVDEQQSRRQLLYPNPSYNGVYRIDYPAQYVTGVLRIYNNFGQLVKVQSLKNQIDISSLPKGLYYYKIQFDATQQVFSGSILYE